ncbi:MAG: hypothetical protein IJX63_14020, partial [Lachnospiraceae bacterium]|nr:hypothetical protein [Lachnospiraceae bacterium]
MKKFLVSAMSMMLAGALLLSPAHTYQSSAFNQEEAEWIGHAQSVLEELLDQKNVMALVYLADKYEVRSAASMESEVVAKVPSGQLVMIEGVELTEEYEAWTKVSFMLQDKQYTGYVQRANLACSDEQFLQWEMEYGMNPSAYMTMFALTDEAVVHADIEQFPDSYKDALTTLKEVHPNWIFVKQETGLDWDYVVEEELKGGRSLIPASLSGSLQEGKFSKGWSYATEEALEYYLDPRNGLTEKWIFQFEQLTFNESYHMDCEAAVQQFLDKTFMKGTIPQSVLTYSYAFWAIGKEMNISPFHLASRVYQEQGKGTSPLISGTYPGYEGYYNYFNIGASGKTDKEVIENGLAYAKKQNWNSPYYALHFGAKTLGANYISKGQDTLYLQKFDVDDSSSGMFWHQYMQNICAPTSEAVSIRKLYEEAGAVDNMFVFKIPVYENMPEECPLPVASDRVILEENDEYTADSLFIDGVEYPLESRNGYLIASGAGMDAETAVMYEYDAKGIPVGMKVWALESDGSAYEVSELNGLEDLMSYHGFSIRITGRAGIRFKTGIAENIRAELLGEGIGGYKLKEYGTLIMNNTTRETYPMIRGGEKVLQGMAYGYDGDGNLIDNIYETVNGRQRFTSVLVGLPATEYKTNYAFRGYMVLSKGEEEITLYGPILHRSIYQLAEQALGMNLYEDGSAAKQFLEQLIADGDSAQKLQESE